MKGSVSVLVSVRQLVLLEPAEQINESNFGSLVAGPVQRCGPSLVLGAQVHSLLLEEEEADRLVALGGDVHHVQTVLVLKVHVGAVVEEYLAHFYVSTEGGVVDGRKFVFLGLHVDPPGRLLVLHFPGCNFHELVEAVGLVLENRHVQQSESLMVNEVLNSYLARVVRLIALANAHIALEVLGSFRLLFQKLRQLLVRVTLDELHALVRHVLDLLRNLLSPLLGLVQLIGLAALPKHTHVVVRQVLPVLLIVLEIHVHSHGVLGALGGQLLDLVNGLEPFSISAALICRPLAVLPVVVTLEEIGR